MPAKKKTTATKELWVIVSLTFIEEQPGACPLISKYTKKPAQTAIDKDWYENNGSWDDVDESPMDNWIV